MFFRIGPLRRTRIVAHREVKAIFGTRTGSLPLNFTNCPPLPSGHGRVFTPKLLRNIQALAMELPPIAAHPHVPPLPSTPIAIAASPARIPVLRLGYFLGVMRPTRGATKRRSTTAN
jgi:hypothetical protein